MKANTDKQLEKFVDKMMKETSLDTPSVGFTAQIMSQVLKNSTSQATVYKPLISKWVWYGLFISMFGIIICLSFNDSAVSGGLLEKFNLGTLPKFSMPNFFSGIHFSKSTFYACVLLTIMLFIQIPVLKYYMDKRFDV